jgi:spore coat polysaccharide biosynthesis protein SpsF (cytidylyltransferase family)
MRITSDCPLIDPVLAGGVLLNVVNGEADYSCNNLPRTWPHGLDCEAFTFDCLLQAAEEAKLPEEREHVTPYLRSHPKIRKTNIAGPGGEIARYRWTLDTAADLEFLKVVFEKLPEGPKGFNYPAVLDIVESDPRLRAHTNPQ